MRLRYPRKVEALLEKPVEIFGQRVKLVDVVRCGVSGKADYE